MNKPLIAMLIGALLIIAFLIALLAGGMPREMLTFFRGSFH